MTELNKVVVDCEGVPNGGNMEHTSVSDLIQTIELVLHNEARETIDPNWEAGAGLVVEAEAILDGVISILREQPDNTIIDR